MEVFIVMHENYNDEELCCELDGVHKKKKDELVNDFMLGVL
jgi:hypothetical protein